MLKSYFCTAIRGLLADKLYSFINILGLTIGLCACMIVATVVIDDLSYDRQWTHSKDLYRMFTDVKMGPDLYNRSAYTFVGFRDALKKNFPDVLATGGMRAQPSRVAFNPADHNGQEINTLTADTAVWSMLDLKVLSGDPKTYVAGKSNIVITQHLSDQYFHGKNPVGATIYSISFFATKPTPCLITGVIANLPVNTHLRADMISLENRPPEALTDAYGTYNPEYVLMKPGTDMTRFTRLVNQWYHKLTGGDSSRFASGYHFGFQPIRDIYLHSDFDGRARVKGNMRDVYIFSAVAVLLLLIGGINFINLSLARILAHVRETAVRKIVGASRKQIVYQSLVASLICFGTATLLAFIFYQAFLPAIARYLGHPLATNLLSQIALFLAAAAVILLFSLLTGIYPAWILSGFKPANALKGKIFASATGGQSGLRKSLVVVQFAISITILIAMIVVRQQVRYMKTTDLGYDKKGLLQIDDMNWNGKTEISRNMVNSIPGVEGCSITTFSPSSGAGFMSMPVTDPANPNKMITVWYLLADFNFAKTLGLHLLEGRFPDKDYAADNTNPDSMIRNTSAIHTLITAYTAKTLHLSIAGPNPKDAITTPVGIVADFHDESLRDPLNPILIATQDTIQYGDMLVRVKPGMEQRVTASLQMTLRRIFPNKPLDIQRVEDLVDRQYAQETKLAQLFSFFSLLAMVLAALGVFGLVVHAASRRVKEIGVRKVLGAPVSSIVRLLAADFVGLVTIALLLAIPTGWWLMNNWLQAYAYRIHINPWIFVFAGAVTMLIALVPVCFQAIKAARANPITSLRSE